MILNINTYTHPDQITQRDLRYKTQQRRELGRSHRRAPAPPDHPDTVYRNGDTA